MNSFDEQPPERYKQVVWGVHCLPAPDEPKIPTQSLVEYWFGLSARQSARFCVRLRTLLAGVALILGMYAVLGAYWLALNYFGPSLMSLLVDRYEQAGVLRKESFEYAAQCYHGLRSFSVAIIIGFLVATPIVAAIVLPTFGHEE